MEQIADAPWIREAENDGMPGAEFQPEVVEDYLGQADYHIAEALKYFDKAGEACEGERVYMEILIDLYNTLADVWNDLKNARKRIANDE